MLFFRITLAFLLIPTLIVAQVSVRHSELMTKKPVLTSPFLREYDVIRPFQNGRAAVCLNHKWGFIDSSATEVVPPEYDRVFDFNTISTMAVKGGVYYLLDIHGNILKKLTLDYFSGFRQGRAKIIKDGKMAFIDIAGNILSPGWRPDPALAPRPAPIASNLNYNCPDNIDFEFGNFANWSGKIGKVRCPTGGSNELYDLTPATLPTLDHQEMITATFPSNVDSYGGFSLNPPDGSNYAVKLGNDNNESGYAKPDARSETLEYSFTIPASATEYNFTYDYAAVLVEPDTIPPSLPHAFCEKPRLRIIITDVTTSTILQCGQVDYTADQNSLSNDFVLSSVPPPQGNGFVWYKPWTQVFVNLTRYAGHTIKVEFITSDCTIGGHWGYAYIDIRGCQLGVKAYNSCNTPTKTILEGPPGFSMYKWFNDSYTATYGTATQRTEIIPALPTGTVVNLEITPYNGSACRDTLTAIVGVQQFNWNAGPDKNICNGDTVAIGFGTINNCSFSWSPTSYLTDPTLSKTRAFPPANASYIVTITDTLSGCSMKDTVAIAVQSGPVVNINNLTFCEGSSGILTATGADTYTWAADPSLLVTSNNTATVNPVVSTSYIVRGQVAGNSCFGRDTAYVTVNPLPAGTLIVPSNNNICEGTPFPLTVNASNTTNYSWYFSTSGLLNTYSAIGAVSGSSYSATQAGYYFVVLSNTSGCVDTASGLVQLNYVPKPVPDFSFVSVCAGKPVQFSNTSNIPASQSVTYSWNFGDNSANSSAFAPSHTYAQGGIYNVSLSVTPVLCPGLRISSQQVIHIDTLFPGIRYPDVYTTRNSNRQLDARGFANQYFWSPSTGLNNAYIRNPVFNYTSDMKYLIRLNTLSGCETVDTQFVYLRAAVDIKVPTAFSPNGDGHNDGLDVFLIDIKELKWFRVFNRWGQLLFETNDPAQRWDGAFRGKPQPAETYVWIAQGVGYNGQTVLRRGQCALLR